MNEEERLILNNYIESLYQVSQIGEIKFEPKHSSELYTLINKLLKENQQLREENIINSHLDKDEYIKDLEQEIKELHKKIKFNEKSRRKMQKSLMKIIQHKQNIINNILDYIDSNKFVEQFENVANERNVRNEILSKIERRIKMTKENICTICGNDKEDFNDNGIYENEYCEECFNEAQESRL